MRVFTALFGLIGYAAIYCIRVLWYLLVIIMAFTVVIVISIITVYRRIRKES